VPDTPSQRPGQEKLYVPPAPDASNWMRNTMEQFRVQARLLELGVTIVPHHGLAAIAHGSMAISCVFTGRTRDIAMDTAVLVTARLPETELADALRAKDAAFTVIGDALAPGTIAAAVFAGRRYAEELDAPRDPDAPLFRLEVTGLVTGPMPWQA
jgi:dimethylamine/trimethylamine dehydrogenase